MISKRVTRIELEGILLPPGSTEMGVCVGRGPDGRYAGWGCVGDGALADGAMQVPQFEETSVGDALILLGSAIGALVRHGLARTDSSGRVIKAADSPRADVIGSGLLAALATELLTTTGWELAGSENGKLDLLLDTTGEPSLWDTDAGRLKECGLLVLLIPPWARPADYDFYPNLHRRSLRTIARRWHHPPEELGGLPPNLYEVASEWISQDEWERTSSSSVSAGQLWRWQRFS